MAQIEIKMDINQDAWNWWEACNKVSHGVDWKQRIEGPLRLALAGKDRSTANVVLLPYLDQYYADHKNELQTKLTEAQNLFAAQAPHALELMARVTGNPIYRDSFTCFLTTFPRCPYSLEKGWVWLCALWPAKCYLGTFLHELQHFQFLHYYAHLPELSHLSAKQIDFLKEALTVILNDEFLPFMCEKDKGYDMHQELRHELETFWEKEKDFYALILFGAGRLMKQAGETKLGAAR
ncbi:hypothetical protein HY631_04950 [Candidatus Uhrbacteria bacterium]|nr:hypothetical protein [Candidatus Uhrbacteria bacterium]